MNIAKMFEATQASWEIMYARQSFFNIVITQTNKWPEY